MEKWVDYSLVECPPVIGGWTLVDIRQPNVDFSIKYTRECIPNQNFPISLGV